MSIERNPKDSMKSTWRQQDRSEWTVFHWLYDIFDIHPVELNKAVPVHAKTDKVRYLNDWYQHRWILAHALIPIALHQLYVVYTGHNLAAWQAALLYIMAFNLNAIRELHLLRAMGHKVGFLDGDVHERDGVPDVSVSKVIYSLILTSVVRPGFTVLIGYDTRSPPTSMQLLWLPFEAGCYGILLDFFFYWYHRLMHEVEGLWKFHRTHHLTKHPNPLLTLYADTEQEMFDIAGIPLITYFAMRAMGFPMGFYEWWVCHQYVVFAELAGHSGVRMVATPPNIFNWFLRVVDAELILEDHDLHHRKGWKSSGNYGKQTRLWDRAFGTCRDRVECGEKNVDYDNQLDFPIL